MASRREVIKRASINSSKSINESIKIENITSSNDNEKFKCSCCGKIWKNQKGHFSKTKSPLYRSNNGYISVCNECRDNYYYQLIPFYNGDERAAIERMCGLFDWYLNEYSLESSRQISDDRSRIGNFLAKKNLSQNSTGDTYLDTIKERFLDSNKIINNSDDLEDVKEYKITPKMIKFWGAGYEPQALQTLQGYYDELLKSRDKKPNVKQQKMLKTLCLLEYQIQINVQNGKDIGTLSNSYKGLLEAAGFNSDETDISNDTFGKWVMDIEKYCPAEYYKDKSKYHDFYGVVDYIERFMFRPLKNLILGTKDKEKEYWINDEDIGK